MNVCNIPIILLYLVLFRIKASAHATAALRIPSETIHTALSLRLLVDEYLSFVAVD